MHKIRVQHNVNSKPTHTYIEYTQTHILTYGYAHKFVCVYFYRPKVLACLQMPLGRYQFRCWQIMWKWAGSSLALYFWFYLSINKKNRMKWIERNGKENTTTFIFVFSLCTRFCGKTNFALKDCLVGIFIIFINVQTLKHIHEHTHVYVCINSLVCRMTDTRTFVWYKVI